MKQLAKSLILILLMAFGGPLSAQPMTVISFNIRYNSYNNIDGENGWPNRKAAVARMILEERPVAIGLQEALIDQLQYLDSALPGYHRVGVGRDDGKEAGEFMAIYYDTARLELVSGTTRWLSATPEEPSLGWDAACRRTVTITRFRDRQTRSSTTSTPTSTMWGRLPVLRLPNTSRRWWRSCLSRPRSLWAAT